MWHANKKGIMTLIVGLALLLGVHFALREHDVQLARQVLALGVCILLFVVGLASWLSVKAPQDNAPQDEGEDEEEP